MTKEEVKDLLHILQLDYGAEANLVYVFYKTPTGLVNNLSIHMRHADGRGPGQLTERQLDELLEQYPDARYSKIVAIEHPYRGLQHWVDVPDVCKQLHTTARTLRRWCREGWLHSTRLGKKVYFDADEIEGILRSNLVQENGRLDRCGATYAPSAGVAAGAGDRA